MVGEALINLAEILRAQTRFAEADPLYRRGLAIQERLLGAEHPNVGTALNNFAELMRTQGRYAEAEPLYRRSLAIREKVLGAGHPDIAQSLNNLALVQGTLGRYAEAEQSFKRSLEILERSFGADHPNAGSALSSLAWVHMARRDWTSAYSFSRRATDIPIRRAMRDRNDVGRTQSSSGVSELQRLNMRFAMLVKAAHRLADQQQNQSARLAEESFVAVQWAQGSGAAASLAQMSAREAKGSTALAHMVRERQDLVSEWQSNDKLLTAAGSRPAEQRNQQAETELRVRLAKIDARIVKIDAGLAKEFPEYAALVNPEPLTFRGVQTQLRANEVLVLFFDTPALYGTPDETFVWAATKDKMRLVRLELGTQGLAREVQALRCGLDAAASDAATSPCGALQAAAGGPLIFDLARAHQLYRTIFGQIEEVIKDKHLLVVPSGALTALPFNVLITDPPDAGFGNNPAYGSAAWIARRHAITVLPSVSSLKALRDLAKASKAAHPFIGFGNPLLVGPDGTDKRAWDRQSCAITPSGPLQIAARSVRTALSKFVRGGLADVELVRSQYPLPETADELCAVAKAMRAREDALYLGAKANEMTIKKLSADGKLAQARVVHFATHGLIAGETEMLATSRTEPALILTPPEKATEVDDGLLTASEIAQLKLDADWVVLSACNTAAGDSDKPGAEALSGLARTFFYAGARTLLVSHWAVNSDATVRLIAKAFEELAVDAQIGRAEAMRRSMLALVNSGEGFAHPANWSPFIVVGEGAQ